MLTSAEKRVMDTIYVQCKDKHSTIISPTDITRLTDKYGVGLNRVEKTVKDLYMDGYFDMVYSDRRGETVYCITLTEKGKAYMRNAKVMKRNLIFKIGFSFALAVFSFLVGVVLKAIF